MPFCSEKCELKFIESPQRKQRLEECKNMEIKREQLDLKTLEKVLRDDKNALRVSPKPDNNTSLENNYKINTKLNKEVE